MIQDPSPQNATRDAHSDHPTDPPDPTPPVCPRCDGCGQLADTDRREPWTAWTDLPVYAAAAVFAGIVKPIPCDACAPTEEVSA